LQERLRLPPLGLVVRELEGAEGGEGDGRGAEPVLPLDAEGALRSLVGEEPRDRVADPGAVDLAVGARALREGGERRGGLEGSLPVGAVGIAAAPAEPVAGAVDGPAVVGRGSLRREERDEEEACDHEDSARRSYSARREPRNERTRGRVRPVI